MGIEIKTRMVPDPGAALQSAKDGERTCEELREALEAGKLGDIVAKHEKLILHYYTDVQSQANKSFQSAMSVARWGFVVLIVTLVYALAFDTIARLTSGVGAAPSGSGGSITVATVGVVSGILIEFIAAINFVLYARGARQFGAFHICLERTHRYLLAYKISEEIKGNRDEALRDLVCIMSNAPMVTGEDIDATETPRRKLDRVTRQPVSAGGTPLQSAA